MPLFDNPTLGQLIQQAAAGIVAQNQANNQLRLQAEQFKFQQEMAQRNLELETKGLDLRERAVKVQEQQIQQAAQTAPFRAAEAQAKARTAVAQAQKTELEVLQGGEKSLTPNARLELLDQVNELATRAETNQLISSFNSENGVDLPTVGTTSAVFARIRALQGDINRFQTDIQAVTTQGLLKDRLGVDQLEIDKKTKELAAWRELVGTQEFQGLRERHDTEGPSPQTREEIARARFPQFADQIDVRVGPERTPAFTFRGVPDTKVNDAWAMLEQGNVDIMADVVLQSTSDTFGAREQAQLQRLFAERFPEPGEAQNEARRNLIRLIRTIRARRRQ